MAPTLLKKNKQITSTKWHSNALSDNNIYVNFLWVILITFSLEMCQLLLIHLSLHKTTNAAPARSAASLYSAPSPRFSFHPPPYPRPIHRTDYLHEQLSKYKGLIRMMCLSSVRGIKRLIERADVQNIIPHLRIFVKGSKRWIMINRDLVISNFKQEGQTQMLSILFLWERSRPGRPSESHNNGAHDNRTVPLKLILKHEAFRIIFYITQKWLNKVIHVHF